MSLMNVLTDFPYRKRYYLLHPWKLIKEIGTNIQAAWHRATRGWAYSDAAEMNEYLLHLIPELLRQIGDDIAYPGTEPFETLEKWQDWCNGLADLFVSLQEENWSEGRNEWEDKLGEAIEVLYPHPNYTTTNTMTVEDAEDVRKLYWEREAELAEERRRLIKNAFTELAKYYDYLWI